MNLQYIIHILNEWIYKNYFIVFFILKLVEYFPKKSLYIYPNYAFDASISIPCGLSQTSRAPKWQIVKTLGLSSKKANARPISMKIIIIHLFIFPLKNLHFSQNSPVIYNILLLWGLKKNSNSKNGGEEKQNKMSVA